MTKARESLFYLKSTARWSAPLKVIYNCYLATFLSVLFPVSQVCVADLLSISKNDQESDFNDVLKSFLDDQSRMQFSS